MKSMRRLIAIVSETLHEIFDETAYRRFLRRSELAISPESYAEFLRENEIVKSRKPKCC